MILRLPNPESAQRWCAQQRGDGRTLGFVPTMGALHQGHRSLVQRAVAENDICCVSIFINPLQFNDPKDLKRYPRDFKSDVRLLEEVACDMVFTGTLEQFFPEVRDPRKIPMRDPGPHAGGLEGEYRKGHFAGVATIVERLFQIVRPDHAYFGEKDFQQSLVVKDVARAMHYPEITVCATAREPSGLAHSSRNLLLTTTEREQATCLSRMLFAARAAWRAGERDAAKLRAVMLDELNTTNMQVEYAELRDPEAWSTESPQGEMKRAQALLAVRIGKVRLIDNLRLDQ